MELIESYGLRESGLSLIGAVLSLLEVILVPGNDRTLIVDVHQPGKNVDLVVGELGIVSSTAAADSVFEYLARIVVSVKHTDGDREILLLSAGQERLCQTTREAGKRKEYRSQTAEYPLYPLCQSFLHFLHPFILL